MGAAAIPAAGLVLQVTRTVCESRAGVSFTGPSFPVCFQQKDIQVAGGTLFQKSHSHVFPNR